MVHGGEPKIKTPADGVSAGAWASVNGLEIDAELRLAVAEVNPQASEAEGNPAVPTIVGRPAVTPVAIEGRPAVATAIERRPTVSPAIDPAAVTKTRVNSPKPTFALWGLWHALATIEEHALAAAVLGLGGGGGDRRRDGEGSSTQPFSSKKKPRRLMRGQSLRLDRRTPRGKPCPQAYYRGSVTFSSMADRTCRQLIIVIGMQRSPNLRDDR
jgi:hypothetical protein